MKQIASSGRPGTRKTKKSANCPSRATISSNAERVSAAVEVVAALETVTVDYLRFRTNAPTPARRPTMVATTIEIVALN